MKILTLLNEKGGVGKTTLAVTFGAGLAIAGYRVMLIDADPQGHAGLSLGIPKAPGLYDLIVRQANWTQVVVDVSPDAIAAAPPAGQLFLVPSNIETKSIFTSVQGDHFAILRYISQLSGEDGSVVDYVIFDTSPTPSEFHEMIYMASDTVIYPSELDYLSLDGLNESLTRLDRANRLRHAEGLPPVQLGAVIPNRTQMRTIEHGESIKQVSAAFGKEKVWRPIQERTDWKQASRAHKSIFAYAPDGEAARSARGMLNTFLQLEGAPARV